MGTERDPGRPPRVLVAGGGIAGLATAQALLRLAEAAGRPLAITVLEKEQRLGGKILTWREGGFVIEGGPDSFLTSKPWAIALCRELGLEARLIPTDPTRRRTYVYARGRLHPIPEGLRLIAPTRIAPFLRSGLVSWPGKLRMGLDLLIPPRRSPEDESIGAFVRRRLGAEALLRLGEPLLAGIYVGDPDRLSLQATFPQLADLERRHGSLIRGMRAGAGPAARPAATDGPPSGPATNPPASMFMSLVGGSAELVEALVARLGPERIHSGAALTGVEPIDGGFRVALATGVAIEADALVLATPAPISAGLIAPWAPELAARLAAIPHASTANVSLAYRADEVPLPLDGTGFVVARDEGLRIAACTWSSAKYAHRAPPGMVLLRAFLGGAGRAADLAQDDAALLQAVREDLARVMGIRAAPSLQRVCRWPEANPQYELGHLERVAAIEAACPPRLALVGAAYRGVGVPDIVHAAGRAAEGLWAALDGPGTDS